MAKKRALLVIGDAQITRTRPYVSFLKFITHAQKLKEKTVELGVINYQQLLSGQLPQIEAPVVKVVFFFPYKHWNRHIEIYQDGRTYGDKKFGREFKAFFREVHKALDRCFPGKVIEYLNPPQVCFLDRDKQATKDLLDRSAVPTPRTFRVNSFSRVQDLINQGLKLYIKPRFGSMGKGITYIDRENVVSNFLFRKGRLVSRSRDFNWRFTRIKDVQGFISELLKKGFICEEAIEPPVFRKRRFDFRVYVLFGKVVYLYAKSSPAQLVVTNWSQGGRIDKRKTILSALPKEKIAMAERLAKRAAGTLGLNFAGIDVIFSKDMKSAYVLEGNAFPGYEKGFDLMKCLLNSVVR
ncbi:MAG: hypothetical protein HQ595_04490 [Candidatus Omnitrophica bacterium]|nr:hypothetical protein [Candidatus Omnitrophota bacterium]